MMTTTERPSSDESSASNRRPQDERETPVWLQDFPHTSAGEDEISRRAFTRYLVAGSGVFAACTVGAAVWTSLRDLDPGSPTPIIDLAEVAEGQTHLFRYPGPDDLAILIHLEGGELVAYSQKCTHLGCAVFYEPDETELICPCHEGIFDPANGEPIAGPPERALPSIALEVRGNTIWALGITR